MIRIGQVGFAKGKIEKNCGYCKEIIEPGGYRAQIVGTRKTTNNVVRFTTYYHFKCLNLFINKRYKSERDNPKVRVATRKLRGKLVNSGLTPEQKRRRHTVQTYLSNNLRTQLIKAYKKQDTDKVLVVQGKMYNFLKELESFGPPFKLKWLDLEGIKCTGDNLELNQLIRQYDYKWLEQLWFWKDNPQRWGEIFVRNNDSSYLPNWSIDSVTE